MSASSTKWRLKVNSLAQQVLVLYSYQWYVHKQQLEYTSYNNIHMYTHEGTTKLQFQ